MRRVAKDLGPNKDEQVCFDLVCLAAAKQGSKYRDSPKHRHTLLTLSKHILKKAAKYEYFSIIDDDGRLNNALIGNQVDCLHGTSKVRDFLRNFQ